MDDFTLTIGNVTHNVKVKPSRDVFGIHEELSTLRRISIVYENIWFSSPPSNKTCESLHKFDAFIFVLLGMNDPKNLSPEKETAYIALTYKNHLQEELRTIDATLIKKALRYRPGDIEHDKHMENIKNAIDAYDKLVARIREKTTEALQQLTGRDIELKY